MKYALFFLIVFSGCTNIGGLRQNEKELVETDEIYEGSAAGYRGPIRVQVYMRAGSITEISVIDSAEDQFVGGAAIEELIDTIIEYNSTDVDAISGATITSMGFLEAVNNAIMKK